MMVTGLPTPGSFGLARIGGLTGKLIAAAQAFAGDGSRWTHAFVVLDNGECIEAEPGGARIEPIGKYFRMKEVAFCDRPVQDWLRGVETLSAKRMRIVAEGRRLEHTRYGYLQYVYMGLLALAGKDGSLDQPRGWFTRWLARRITQGGSMICSQLVDEVYRRAGIEIFDDHRLPQNVTPGDLAIRFGIA